MSFQDGELEPIIRPPNGVRKSFELNYTQMLEFTKNQSTYKIKNLKNVQI